MSLVPSANVPPVDIVWRTPLLVGLPLRKAPFFVASRETSELYGQLGVTEEGASQRRSNPRRKVCAVFAWMVRIAVKFLLYWLDAPC